jgi:hypothetical protein
MRQFDKAVPVIPEIDGYPNGELPVVELDLGCRTPPGTKRRQNGPEA